MITNTRKKLNLSASGRLKLSCSRYLQVLMHELWFRQRRHTSKTHLGDYYLEAFKEFLFRNKIPKQIPRVERRQLDLMIPDEGKTMLKQMEAIAMKRQQSLAVIVEQALDEYLSKPENYLGKNQYKSGTVEKINSESDPVSS